jgi:hypothetical protein
MIPALLSQFTPAHRRNSRCHSSCFFSMGLWFWPACEEVGGSHSFPKPFWWASGWEDWGGFCKGSLSGQHPLGVQNGTRCQGLDSNPSSAVTGHEAL